MQRPIIRRGFSFAVRESGDTEEEESLLPDEDHANDSANDIPVPPNPHAHLPVYATIHRQAFCSNVR
jgi:hypothetical protein